MTPKLDATYIRIGHQIRPPGEPDWLTVIQMVATTLEGRAAVLIRTEGDREFVTLHTTGWPCRIAEAVSA